MSISPSPVSLRERLVLLSDLWTAANSRSRARLSTIVARDGKFLDRVAGGAGCTVATAERFFSFFREPANWPGDVMPKAVLNLLDNVDLGAAHDDGGTPACAAASSGSVSEVSAEERAA